MRPAKLAGLVVQSSSWALLHRDGSTLCEAASADLQAAERRWTALEKEVHARTRAFARYMAPGAHNALADGLVLEQRLRGRIQVRQLIAIIAIGPTATQ